MNIKLTYPLLVAFCVASLVLYAGCENASVSETATKKAPPKLSFHKPRSFRLAVERIREIHDSLVADGEMPQPISYTVVEVSHAHAGGKSHVHYHLVESEHEDCECEDGHDHGHDHGHDKDPFQNEAEPKPGQHTVVIDAFTELRDVARWLPAIASDSDMPADQWKQVESIAANLTDRLEKVSGTDASSQRTQYKSKQEEISAEVSKLEAFLKPNAAKVL